MKKRKTYGISVIDRTYSKTISDETKFYTSDTALELGFELKETEYTFDSAEIVLLNIDDRSLTTRPVSKVNNDFVYELDDDIIPHYGEWHGQLRFEAGEIYVSSPVKFRIENDLSNDRPPQLSEVQSWVSLKRYADKLTDELKQAVLSVEGIEDTFNANELERQTTFETAEQSRQTTFNTNESNRTETFNANEALRQENEATRQQAEAQRMSAEEQRKIDHANRSGELDGKADKVVVNNQIENGAFNNGIEGWLSFYSNIEAKEGYLTLTSNGDFNKPYTAKSTDITYGDIYYGASKVKPLHEVRTIFMVFNATNHQYINNPEVNKYHRLSFTHKLNSTNPFVGVRTELLESIQGIQLDITEFILINLTQTFGSGNEPTKEEMDKLIEITGYIDGEYALNNKEMLIWTLALIRRNKNAIITLGGTI